jgi:hypothetical protein
MTITRKRYLDREITHHEYYGAIVELLGEEELQRLLPGARTPAEWRELIAADEHLNNVPLRRWDALDYYVRSMAARADRDALRAITGSNGWSLSDSVCTLKTAARRYAEEV